MKIKYSNKGDVNAIKQIINYAQKYLASLNIDQWQNGYPNENQILHDIENKESYIIINEKEKIIATFMFTTRTESTYVNIEGKWLTDEAAKYGVIHRIAVAKNTINKGVAKYIISKCENNLKKQEILSMRIDTHKDNLGMQHILEKLAYTYCGIITLASGDIRLAYEKILS